MREKFDEILEDHGIYGEDVEDVLNAVFDMITYVADETKKNEPYAVNSIDRLKIAAHEVLNLSTDLYTFTEWRF